MRNSIVAGNHAPTNPNIVGTLTSDGYNLIQDVSSAISELGSTDVLVDPQTDLGINPRLRDNSGLTTPHPFTHALLAGSLAIDKIPLQNCQVKDIFNDQSQMYTDQRSMKRPDENESACDIGAYEYVDSPT